MQVLLYFGTEKPSGHVTPEEWAGFLGEVVTPRFPHGSTVWRASGQWQSASGRIIHEPSYVLDLVHPAGDTYEPLIGEVVAAYKDRFQQEAVLQVRSNVCAAF